jgi:hypothetical protein
MSTLLERMILRTRAPLSSLEPLVEPRYAPAAQAAPLPSDEQASDATAADVAEPGTAIGPDPDMGRGAGQQPRARPGATHPAAARLGGDDVVAHDAKPLSTRPRSTPRSSAQPAAATQPSAGDEARPQPPAARPPRPGNEQTEAQPRPAAPSWPQSTPLSPPTAAQPHPGSEEAEPRRTGEASPATVDRADSSGPIVAKPDPLPNSVSGMQPVAVSARLMPASPPASGPAGTRGPKAPQTPGDADVAGPDVTISIGHIEVRSAPATVQRPKPAFRPQVSLADFLARRQDGRP